MAHSKGSLSSLAQAEPPTLSLLQTEPSPLQTQHLHELWLVPHT